MRKIRVAIVGVGNCANSLVQGVSYYSANELRDGLITKDIGGYTAKDIEIVGAFDVTRRKVGKDLNEAIWEFPNNTIKFCLNPLSSIGAPVVRGPTLDGLGKYLSESVIESDEEPVNLVDTLKKWRVDVLVNYLPVGSEEAARRYAQAALTAKVGFVNCMPTFIVSGDWAKHFMLAGVPCIGDDVKSQVGATIVHRALAILMRERGVKLKRTSQLNVGGNADFLNMLERDRLKTKKISKTQAVTSVMGVTLFADDVHIGPSDYVPWLTDRKVAHIRLEGEGFGGVPTTIELKLEVWDSPNSAGVVMDAIRCIALAQDRGENGPIMPACAYYMKSPPTQYDDSVAHYMLSDWIAGEY